MTRGPEKRELPNLKSPWASSSQFVAATVQWRAPCDSPIATAEGFKCFSPAAYKLQRSRTEAIVVFASAR